MKQKEDIKFIKGLLKLEPNLLSQNEHDLCKTFDLIFQAVYNRRSTREFVRIALSQHKKNKLKRDWSLKYKYAVAIFCSNPTISIRRVAAELKSKFGQKTRPTVLESAKEDAAKMPRATRIQFMLQTHTQAATRSNDTLGLTF